MEKILVVEDELRLQKILGDTLKSEGYNCTLVADGVNAINMAIASEFDLIILDIMLPYIDGISVCKVIRDKSDAPVIFLTAKGEEDDIVTGYKVGASDYITKPFSLKEFVAKVKVLLHYSLLLKEKKDEIIKAGNITMNIDRRIAYVNGEVMELTYKEWEVLKFFITNQGRALSRQKILEDIWGYGYGGNTRTVDTHVKTLRKKMGDAGRYIITMINLGYKFEVIE